MLKIFAISSASTTALRTTGGKAVLMLAASPWPVVRPISAQSDWIADMSG
jgi:hypothetical protein